MVAKDATTIYASEVTKNAPSSLPENYRGNKYPTASLELRQNLASVYMSVLKEEAIIVFARE